ncbi:MAG: sulfite oxidase [Dehalococcoidia bacterium]
MALFVVQHRHEAAYCPARNAEMAPMLLAHLAPANAQQFGVSIQGEAVLDGAHTLVLILDAPDEARVNQFMQPFTMAGSVEVQSASHCETVVERGDCEPASVN